MALGMANRYLPACFGRILNHVNLGLGFGGIIDPVFIGPNGVALRSTSRPARCLLQRPDGFGVVSRVVVRGLLKHPNENRPSEEGRFHQSG